MLTMSLKKVSRFIYSQQDVQVRKVQTRMQVSVCGSQCEVEFANVPEVAFLSLSSQPDALWLRNYSPEECYAN